MFEEKERDQTFVRRDRSAICLSDDLFSGLILKFVEFSGLIDRLIGCLFEWIDGVFGIEKK